MIFNPSSFYFQVQSLCDVGILQVQWIHRQSVGVMHPARPSQAAPTHKPNTISSSENASEACENPADCHIWERATVIMCENSSKQLKTWKLTSKWVQRNYLLHSTKTMWVSIHSLINHLSRVMRPWAMLTSAILESLVNLKNTTL